MEGAGTCPRIDACLLAITDRAQGFFKSKPAYARQIFDGDDAEFQSVQEIDFTLFP